MALGDKGGIGASQVGQDQIGHKVYRPVIWPTAF